MFKWIAIIIWSIVGLVIAIALYGLFFISPASPEKIYLRQMNEILNRVDIKRAEIITFIQETPPDEPHRFRLSGPLNEFLAARDQISQIEPPPTFTQLHRQIITISDSCKDVLVRDFNDRILIVPITPNTIPTCFNAFDEIRRIIRRAETLN